MAGKERRGAEIVLVGEREEEEEERRERGGSSRGKQERHRGCEKR